MGSGQQGELTRSLLIPGSLRTRLAREHSVLERTYIFFERKCFGFLSFSTKLRSNRFKNYAFRDLQCNNRPQVLFNILNIYSFKSNLFALSG